MTDTPTPTETPTEAPKKWLNFIIFVFKSGTHDTIYFYDNDHRDAAYAVLKDNFGTSNDVEIDCYNGRAMIDMAQVAAIRNCSRR